MSIKTPGILLLLLRNNIAAVILYPVILVMKEIVSFTRSLSSNLVKKGIRVNGVAPGPIWTPLIASSFPKKKVAVFGSEVPMGRAGEPAEIAPAYLFLASDDASYITGQFIHPN